MKFTKEDINLENGLKREWLITNGMGGFASSTIIGANTRRYHGLLIAPLMPPAQRYLILSKVDESIQIENEKYDLYTNVGENYISQGYKFQESFEKNIFPTFKYNVAGVNIEKTICMEYGKEVVEICYKIKNINKHSLFTLAPIVNFRDFHSMSTKYEFDIKQKINNTKVKIIVDENKEKPIYMYVSDGKYTEYKNNIFKDMFYIEEQKRGFYPKENHSVVGVYEINLQPNEEKTIFFTCGLESNIENINVDNMLKNEKNRIQKIIQNAEASTETEFETELIKATDQFVVYRPAFELHTLIAGYPWFLDWGRDSLLSLEGLLLKTKRYDIAKEVLLTMAKNIKCGLVPNGYSEKDNKPLYNSVDASLLLFEQIQKYLNYTGDYEFVKEHIYDKLKEIIENYKNGIDLDDNNIKLDKDFLISSGTANTQNTWMDAKTYGIAATPRNGKVVEINSLWYNSLMIMADLAEKFEEQHNIKKYKELARKCKKSFNAKFYNSKRKCLYDVITDEKNKDGKIRPNQLFALSLTYPIVEPNSIEANNIINVVEKKLLNNYGLKTLAKGEPNYFDIYEGDAFKRDMSYHQGITWTWLLELYYEALKNMVKFEKRKTYKTKLETKLKDFVEKEKQVFEKEINQRGCVGSIAEIYDSTKPYEPKGAIAQAWSVGAICTMIL